ncbi:(2Fe-2S)-binding protein [Subsaxibacter sp. CAU 1640]|uniref:(2Fe-2S)-binding protein n=1 Tax=Subsaxibacter sp. CAU 1640 TaxID=2933271 RepID=UPI00200301D7|nr:(2Fe-2S)-binding protein [Subsaxibacter sp. CAU 1640]MCK7591700.1 (2Fe-2S)-binding protein [Subsaxibacter sp. CAU 1640]
MKNFTIKVNGTNKNIESTSDKPLLWVLREDLHLTGTKYGCGFGVCGACVIHLNGSPERSCQITIEECHEKEITTIEGLSNNSPHYVQQAWIEENVPQCGYCQCGQIMSATALLDKSPNPTDEEIDEVMGDNYCRCGTYPRIKKAIHRAIQFKKQ